MEETLQAGADIVATHSATMGLNCSPTKSELLRLHPTRHRTNTGPPSNIRIDVGDQQVPEVDKLQPPYEWQLTDVERWEIAVSSSDHGCTKAAGWLGPKSLESHEPAHQ
ncbi:hypothetical protein HPB52_013678 [Rhipicephalus sanguineus]|uniref:Uncharacterized protein n=1 Tax=Rhipicephalus sanguineus TaxID=34632 RepID=A0A9D4TA80_RHISA|nr:hypothetical protein HPB52_013678 [Rhipicephalus sanguineus]